MPSNDITCSHCGEPTDAPELWADSIGYLPDDQADLLAPLGTVRQVLDHLALLGYPRDRWLSNELDSADELPSAIDDMTLPMLFTFYWTSNRDTTDVSMLAAARIVQTAIYVGTLTGKGCPACGFAHTGTGPYRAKTLHDLVVNGVTDTDPTLYLTAEEIAGG